MTESDKKKPNFLANLRGKMPEALKECPSSMEELESDAQALQDLEDAMQEGQDRIATEPASAVKPVLSYQYHVCIVASIKGDNIFSDALVNVPAIVDSAEPINALRNAMAQQMGALPERVTIVGFQCLKATHV